MCVYVYHAPPPPASTAARRRATTGCFSKESFLLSITISQRGKTLFRKNSFYQPGPRMEKNCLGILKNQLVSGISENYHESLRSFWDPILELKSEFSAEILHFEVEKVIFSGALRAPKRILFRFSFINQARARKRILRNHSKITNNFFLLSTWPEDGKRLFGKRIPC